MERGQIDPNAEARRLEDELDKVPQREKNPQEKLPHLKPITPKPTFNPSRVKSSIPKQSEHAKQVASAKKRHSEKSAAYIEELKTVEVKRAVQMEEQDNITRQLLERFRDNPNSELHMLSNEVGLLNRKIEPLLRRVEQATDTIKLAGHHKSLS